MISAPTSKIAPHEVIEIVQSGEGPPRLLIEIPHGATERAHYDFVRERLSSHHLPDELEAFFFVNTDIGTPEVAAEIRRRILGRNPGFSVIVLRSLVPRTFIDCNRHIGIDHAGAGITQAIPDYIRNPRDLEMLGDLHRSYQEAADRAYERVCGSGGLAIALHSYAPRSVAIEHVDDQIVRKLRRAYEPEQWQRWPERPPIDILDRDDDGQLLSPRALVEEIVQRYREAGIDARRSDTYRLHPATAGYRHARRYPDRVLCLEMRRDLLADPFEPFRQMRIGAEKVELLAAPLVRALAECLI